MWQCCLSKLILGGRVGSGHRRVSLTNTQSGCSSHRPSATEVEAHARILRKACMLLRLRMQKELAIAPTDWMQEYRCLLTLEGLQTVVGQCLHRIQVLQAGEVSSPALPVLRSELGSSKARNYFLVCVCGGAVIPLFVHK